MTILLVRHGKAAPISGGDYDQLSDLGHEQATALGDYWGRNGVKIAKAFVGPRRRHARTHDAVAEAYVRHGLVWPEPVAMPELDEHDGLNLVAKLLPQLAADAESRKAAEAALTDRKSTSNTLLLDHFKVLTRAWVRGEVGPEGVEPWLHFRARVARGRALMEEAAASIPGKGAVAAFTSAGPVAAMVSDVLGVANEGTVLELSWSLNNGSVSMLGATEVGWMIRSFNITAHLTDPRLLTHV